MACPTDPSQECPVSGDQILSNLNFDKVGWVSEGGDHKKLIILGELLAEHWSAGSAGCWFPMPRLSSPPLKDIQTTLTFDLLDIPCAPLY